MNRWHRAGSAKSVRACAQNVRTAAVEVLEGRRMLSATASISGRVTNDAAGLGKSAHNAGGVANVQVYADLNTNGSFDADEPTSTSGATGAWSLEGLNPGTVTVREVVPGGWRNTTPTAMTVRAKGVVKNRTFALTQKAVAGGIAFIDADGDGRRGAGEKGAAGARVYVDSNVNGKFDRGEKFVNVKANGAFQFALDAGSYSIREVPKRGYGVTFPLNGNFTITRRAWTSISTAAIIERYIFESRIAP
jgi:serine-aspartate repeat-containing protein C/D/E